MRRPSNNTAAPVTMEMMLVAFQRQTSETLRVSAYRILTGASDQEREVALDDMEVVTRPALAKLLKCKPCTVDYHRRAGRLTPVYIPGSSRLRGFTAQSVRALLRGECAKEVA